VFPGIPGGAEKGGLDRRRITGDMQELHEILWIALQEKHIVRYLWGSGSDVKHGTEKGGACGCRRKCEPSTRYHIRK